MSPFTLERQGTGTWCALPGRGRLVSWFHSVPDRGRPESWFRFVPGTRTNHAASLRLGIRVGIKGLVQLDAWMPAVKCVRRLAIAFRVNPFKTNPLRYVPGVGLVAGFLGIRLRNRGTAVLGRSLRMLEW